MEEPAVSYRSPNYLIEIDSSGTVEETYFSDNNLISDTKQKGEAPESEVERLLEESEGLENAETEDKTVLERLNPLNGATYELSVEGNTYSWTGDTPPEYQQVVDEIRRLSAEYANLVGNARQ